MSEPSALDLVAAEVAEADARASTQSRGFALLEAVRRAGFGDASLRIALSRLERPPPPKPRREPPFNSSTEVLAVVFLFLHDLQVQRQYRLCEAAPLLQEAFGMDPDSAQRALKDYLALHMRVDFDKLEREMNAMG